MSNENEIIAEEHIDVKGLYYLDNVIDELIIEDEDTIKELLSFVVRHNSYAADEGHTDDLVMCLVLFAWLTKQGYFKELTNIDIRKELFDGEIKKIEEDDWFSFGFISGYDDIEDTTKL